MIKPKLATTLFMDEHTATCQEARCWLCDTYRRVHPEEYRQAIARYLAQTN